jgi:threonine synthase
VIATCQECGTRQPEGDGHCARCGGVCLRDRRWTPATESQLPPTPLIQSANPRLRGAWLKVEGTQLSGSFKDRVMRVLVAEAIDAGAPGAIVASSGNAAVAAASECARRGLPLLVIVPDSVPVTILRMVGARGAALMLAGEGPADAHRLAKRLSAEFGLPNLASTFGASGCEWACRGIGHELAAQTGARFEPDAVASAVSVGPVLLGTVNGLAEAVGRRPAMVAAQAAGCAPIARAFALGQSEVVPWTADVTTGATSIADRLTGYAGEGTYFLGQVRDSGGSVHAIEEEALRTARAELARYDGIDVELSSSAAIVALERSGLASETAVCVLTGNGLRETLAPTAPDTAPDGPQQFFERIGLDVDVERRTGSWSK